MRRGDLRNQWQVIRERVEGEEFRIPGLSQRGVFRVGLGYPASYGLGAASLGFASILQAVNSVPGAFTDRFFLPDGNPRNPRGQGSRQPVGPRLVGYETGEEVNSAGMVAVSMAWELDLIPLIRLLVLAGLAPLSSERSSIDPPLILGGPLTFANPACLYPFGDVVVAGEGEVAMVRLTELAMESRDKETFLNRVAQARIEGVVVPGMGAAGGVGDGNVTRGGECGTGGESGSAPWIQPCTRMSMEEHSRFLPASSAWVTGESSFPNSFLVEVSRGCLRSCAYCVMAGTGMGPAGLDGTPGCPRIFSVDRILESIPDPVERVGLVGAAVTDHPGLHPLLEELVGRGVGVTLSSMRPEKITGRLLELLSGSGLKSVTTALDGASARLREFICRGTEEGEFHRVAELAGSMGMRLKLYLMIGLPGETDGDVAQACDLLLELSKETRIALTVSPFVPKSRTALADYPFASMKVLRRRLSMLKRRLTGRVDVRNTSVRSSWVEASVVAGGESAGLAAWEGWQKGGTLSQWMQALKELGVADPSAGYPDD